MQARQAIGAGFLSTLPARGATRAAIRTRKLPEFLSTLPARGATTVQGVEPGTDPISIHAPREGSDRQPRLGHHRGTNFYPRSPRGERRAGTQTAPPPSYFYPRSPRGERRDAAKVATNYITISIHAPREGSDAKTAFRMSASGISIHAPREGSDLERQAATFWQSKNFYPRSPRGERPVPLPPAAAAPNFYPRSPRGERPGPTLAGRAFSEFLSTLPARGATRPYSGSAKIIRISIHAPREGSDRFGNNAES